MKKFKIIYTGILVTLFSIAGPAGCSKQESGSLFGTIIGAGIGMAIAGNDHDARVVGAMFGGVAGAALGASIGKSLDKADRAAMNNARYNSLEHTRSGQTTAWHNPDTGHSGTYVAKPASQERRSGKYCREYQQTVTIGGEVKEAYGKACRQADGSWKIENS